MNTSLITPVPSPSSERDPAPRRVSPIRRALLEAGKRLLSNGRFGQASIDDIVREADVAKGSFYNHFETREALLDEVINTVKIELGELIYSVQKGIEDPAERVLRGLMTAILYGVNNALGAQMMRSITPELTDPDAEGNVNLARDVRICIAEGAFNGVEVDAAVILLLGLADFGLARLLDLRGEFQRAREMLGGVGEAALRALGVDARRRPALVQQCLAAVVDPAREELSLRGPV